MTLDETLETIETVTEGTGSKRTFLKATLFGIGALLLGTDAEARPRRRSKPAPKPVTNPDDALLRKYSRYQSPLRVSNPKETIKWWGAWGAGRRGKYLTKTHNPHPAVDMVCKIGTPLYPMAAGKVVYAGDEKHRRPEYWRNGNVIEIETPNGLRTFYAHLSRTRVKTGDYVTLDTVVGYSGISGNANPKETKREPHVHVQVRQNGVPVPPTNFFSGSYYAVAQRDKARYLSEFRTIEQKT